MKKTNVKSKIGCMLFIMLVFCLWQDFAAECGDVNLYGTIYIVDGLPITRYYVDLNPAHFDSSMADVE